MTKSRIITIVLSVVISFIFIQSLAFKFTGSPETDHIFETLDAWAAGFGFSGLFVPPGPFNAYVIGTAELIASAFLLWGAIRNKACFTAVGAVMAVGVISGAIFFHLFTPLGVEVHGDGGTLFIMACIVWISGAILALKYRKSLPIIGDKL